jgi:hypothetical protein
LIHHFSHNEPLKTWHARLSGWRRHRTKTHGGIHDVIRQ